MRYKIFPLMIVMIVLVSIAVFAITTDDVKKIIEEADVVIERFQAEEAAAQEPGTEQLVQEPSQEEGISSGTIIGSAVGGGVALFVIIALFLRRKKEGKPGMFSRIRGKFKHPEDLWFALGIAAATSAAGGILSGPWGAGIGAILGALITAGTVMLAKELNRQIDDENYDPNKDDQQDANIEKDLKTREKVLKFLIERLTWLREKLPWQK